VLLIKVHNPTKAMITRLCHLVEEARLSDFHMDMRVLAVRYGA
jgi:hypothetical protein